MSKSMSRSQIITCAIIAAVCIAAVVFLGFFYEDKDAWRASISGFLEMAQGTPWALPLVCALFVISGVVLFPISILNLACAMVFGYWGILYAIIGGMLNTAVYFGAGHYVRHHQGGKKLLSHPKVAPVDKKLQQAGVAGIVLLHTFPVPSFSGMNFIGGLSSVNFTIFFLGTFIALIPGALARGLVGDSLTKIILHPQPETWAYLVFGLAFWGALIWATHALLKRFVPEDSALRA